MMLTTASNLITHNSKRISFNCIMLDRIMYILIKNNFPYYKIHSSSYIPTCVNLNMTSFLENLHSQGMCKCLQKFSLIPEKLELTFLTVNYVSTTHTTIILDTDHWLRYIQYILCSVSWLFFLQVIGVY